MSRGVNKVILIGNLGADPEMRSTHSETAVAHLRIATTRVWRDKLSGELREDTEWHRIVCFGRLAEIARDYLRKGRRVYVEGRLKTSKWQDQETGADRYITEVIANELQMLDSRESLPSAMPIKTDSPQSQEKSGEKVTGSIKQQPNINQVNTQLVAYSPDDVPF